MLPFQSATNIAPSSVLEVTRQQVSIASENSKAQLVIGSLKPASTYSVYCLTESFKGISMSVDVMLSLTASFTTACCKNLAFTQTFTSVYSGESLSPVGTLALDALPDEEVVVVVSAAPTDGNVPSIENLFYPEYVTFTNTSVTRIASFSMVAGSVGSYQLIIGISGASAAEFSYSFANGESGGLNVLATSEEPPIPVVVSAVFLSDGSAVEISFDSPTNKGGATNSFPCTEPLSVRRCKHCHM